MVLADLGRFGTVRDVVPQIQAVTVQAPAYELAAIQALSYVAAANPDAERNGGPVDAVAVSNFASGISTWNLDAVNVTNLQVGPDRTVAYDGSDGTYRPTGDLGDIAIPETLQSLIASRLDTFNAGDRSLIQDAAVLGQTFTPAALAAVTGSTAEELEPRLRALVRREVLELQADPRSPERGQYAFVQSLIREVASLGGDLSNLIPENVHRRLEGRFSRLREQRA
jgi:hypothetical protein